MDHPDQPLYRYRFDDAEFDEARVALHVAGARVDLEQRPLQVLALLLQRVDEVVPRAVLFDKVWEGRPTVDNVLANAVAKLRKALGDVAGARIVNVPRVGYRLCGPVERIVAGRLAAAPFELKAGQPMPGREHFTLRECLDPTAGGSVWMVRHDKTGELRVYKFAADGERLAALKREVTIHRLLRESVGERDDLVRIVDWNFDTAPYWLQSEYAGRDLARWARDEPAFAASSREQRIAWFLQIADAVAAAHGAGVLHKDLKPSNVLVAARGDDWQLRVSDFGSGRLLEPGRLEQLGITRLGMTVTSALPLDSGVTLLYLAPEVLGGAAPSIKSDVYALGLMLFQMLVGDMHRTLAPGWEQAIDDDLLREDIALATNGDPERRLASVDALLQRLRSREARAVERHRLRDSDARALLAERLLERSRARRPWLIAAIVLLAAGLIVSLWQIRRVRAARAEAEHQATLAKATNAFLNRYLLGAGMGAHSPAWNERDPRLSEILATTATRVDRDFKAQPELRATIHNTLAQAYRSTGDYKAAAVQLQAAMDGWRQLAGASDQRTLVAQYELAQAFAGLSRFKEAEALLASADKAAGARRNAVSAIALHAHVARADVAYQQLQVNKALPEYQIADRLQRLVQPDNVLLSTHILLAMAGCDARSGRPKEAEAAARRVLAGPPYTEEAIGLGALASAHMHLGDALRGQGRYREAIAPMQQAVVGYEKSVGADSQGAIFALSRLSHLYSLAGDDAKALAMQRKVYERAAKHWGAASQAALIELLNLAGNEQDTGAVKQAVQHLQQAVAGLVKVSGANSAVVQAGKVMLARALSDLGQNDKALAMLDGIDPVAYQATTADPGQAEILQAIRAQVELRMHRAGADAKLREAIAAMRKAGVAPSEIAGFSTTLSKGDKH